MATPVKYRNGLIGTIIFHGGLLALLMFLAFRTPLPLPEEQGILVDFGNSRQGWGNVEPRASEPAPQPQPAVAATPQQQSRENNPVLTQNNEEAPTVAPKTDPKEQDKPKEETKKPVDPPKPVEEPKRTVNQRAMYTRRSDNADATTSQGETGGQGNHGSPTGTPNVHVYGEGGGEGNSFSLTGRGLQGILPKPVYNSQEQGIVVVEITVDKDGNVIDAESGVKGSTTLDKTLLDAALKAARRAKFTRKPDSPVQKGTITYIFKIQGE
ncbi:MAG: TonB family protein [Bacteroidales bacterium]|jgi:TonB family protein|nr:TonB family protein [Bacteroidales bacterium]